MRISTQSLFENGAARIGDLQSALAKTDQQIATGRRVLSPADDPVASARALDISQTLMLNTQYGVNRQHAKSSLGMVEGTLSNVTALLQDVKATVIAAGNGALSDVERGFMAAELEGRYDQLLGLANTRDAVGNYLFSGFQSNTPAFVATATGATYQGDMGQQLLQVDATRQMAASSPGQTVFQGGGQDIFQTLKEIITLLNTPGTAGLPVGLATANTNLDMALDNVLTVRASFGARLQELDSLDNVGEDRNLQYKEILSDLQDLDYTQALTQLSQQKIMLEAAQRSFVAISSLSLFNFL